MSQPTDTDHAQPSPKPDPYADFLGHVMTCPECSRGTGHCEPGEQLRQVWRAHMEGQAS
ncbi:hypothetical protein ACWCXE_20950 [Streptomyces sp. NPDC001780]